VLADQKAELIPEPGLAVAGVGGMRPFDGEGVEEDLAGSRTHLTLPRAEADPVSLAQGAVDGSRLSDTHLGPVDQRGHIGGICIAVTNEYFRIPVFINDA